MLFRASNRSCHEYRGRLRKAGEPSKRNPITKGKTSVWIQRQKSINIHHAITTPAPCLQSNKALTYPYRVRNVNTMVTTVWETRVVERDRDVPMVLSSEKT